MGGETERTSASDLTILVRALDSRTISLEHAARCGVAGQQLAGQIEQADDTLVSQSIADQRLLGGGWRRTRISVGRQGGQAGWLETLGLRQDEPAGQLSSGQLALGAQQLSICSRVAQGAEVLRHQMGRGR